MKINRLLISFIEKKNKSQTSLFFKEKEYDFKNINLITSSDENSQGKTSLLRFILYALGYRIPQTDGINIYDYKTILEIEENNKKYILVREGKKQFINNKSFSGIDCNIPMINNVLGIGNNFIVENLLGSFYLDQEKGWTLLNRGVVLGKNRFNIERFFIGITGKNDLDYILLESNKAKKENESLNIIKIVAEQTKDYHEIKYSDSFNFNREKLNELEEEKNLIEQKLCSKQRELKKNNNIISSNNNFLQSIEDMNIIIFHKGEEFLITRKNLVANDLNADILAMKSNELNLEISSLKKESDIKKMELKEFRNSFSSDEHLGQMSKILSQIGSFNFDILGIDEVVEKNKEILKNNRKTLKNELKTINEEFWIILKPILRDVGIAEDYITKDIILTDKLSGKSGTQLHKLCFAYKIALNLFIEKKLCLNLPFIIDSPRSGEINHETSSNMLNLCFKYLGMKQLMISSVYSDYKLDFEFHKIVLTNGVLEDIEKFKIRKMEKVLN